MFTNTDLRALLSYAFYPYHKWFDFRDCQSPVIAFHDGWIFYYNPYDGVTTQHINTRRHPDKYATRTIHKHKHTWLGIPLSPCRIKVTQHIQRACYACGHQRQHPTNLIKDQETALLTTQWQNGWGDLHEKYRYLCNSYCLHRYQTHPSKWVKSERKRILENIRQIKKKQRLSIRKQQAQRERKILLEHGYPVTS